MATNEIEVLLYAVALMALAPVILPRLNFYLQLRQLNIATVRQLGNTACFPKPIKSRQSFHIACKSVQKGLAKNKGNFRWMIKLQNNRDGIEQAVRIEGFLPAGRQADFNNSLTSARCQTSYDLKITVDVYKNSDGSEIVWKYLPSDSSEFQRRQQVFDYASNFILMRTNFDLLKALQQRP